MAKKKETANKQVIKGRITGKELYLADITVSGTSAVATVEDIQLSISGRPVGLDRLVASFGAEKARLEIEKVVKLGLGFSCEVRIELQ